MFSQGQLIFAILFFIVFVILIILSYKKDRVLHKKYYKGSVWVFVGFLVFFLFLFAIKYLLK
ncbi:MAG: hypothetical protein COZ75_03675 [Flavobacteriaceae bacterium CG_4_8_14_3_um_filter_34_10]|nr:MAG: hypothetical protein COS19_03950 [Flavobacteriaceae bacterium CG02_land_8_20_14_3_00_34_13]PIX10035.1 MAG: hypothetical protein COZ75_03675 [Flavobacteriaceae bacterium CG_4_8_14_3_um_filter_34_10]